jgi:hypothetical protein
MTALPQSPQDLQATEISPELWQSFENGDDIVPPTLMTMVCSHVQSNLDNAEVCERFCQVLGAKLTEFPHNVIACDDLVVTTVLACMLAYPHMDGIQYNGVMALKGLCRDAALETVVFGRGGLEIISAARRLCPAAGETATELLSNFLGFKDTASARHLCTLSTH